MKLIFALIVFAMTAAASTHAQAQSINRVTTVITGRLARAGSTNKAPLDDAALVGLCEQGYKQAIYVYKGGSPREVTCSKGKIAYLSMTNWASPAPILNKIATGGKTMVHCWWGVHASNFVTAAALVKMCNKTGAEAAEIFRDGIPKGSLATGRIEELAAKIEAMSPDGTKVSGCP